MIRILTSRGDVITSPQPLADFEQALADGLRTPADPPDIEVPNRFGYTEPLDARCVVAVWEAGPIDRALGSRRTAREVVLELIHANPGVERRQLHHSQAWRLAGWEMDPNPRTIDAALRQLERGGAMTRHGDGHHLTEQGIASVALLREDHLLVA